ncbi:MAG: hypothetical protein J0L93_10345 [Deltaproteobacteria bacterium]|nr:hypothetical protein [Deltaproteobacteria bacterium]
MTEETDESPPDYAIYVNVNQENPSLRFLPTADKYLDPHYEIAFVNMRRVPNATHTGLITKKLGLYYLHNDHFRPLLKEGVEALIHAHGYSSVGGSVGIQYRREPKLKHSYTQASSHIIQRIRDGFYILQFAKTDPSQDGSGNIFYQIQFPSDNPSWALSTFSENLSSIAFVNGKGLGGRTWQTKIFKRSEVDPQQSTALSERSFSDLEAKDGIATGKSVVLSASGKYLVTQYGSDDVFQLWNVDEKVQKTNLPYLRRVSAEIIQPLMRAGEKLRELHLFNAAISANDRWLAVAIRAEVFKSKTRRISYRYITLLWDLEAPQKNPIHFVSPENQTSSPALNLTNDGFLRIVTSSLEGITIADFNGDTAPNLSGFIPYPKGIRPNTEHNSTVHMSARGDRISVKSFNETHLFFLKDLPRDSQNQKRPDLNIDELSVYMFRP